MVTGTVSDREMGEQWEGGWNGGDKDGSSTWEGRERKSRGRKEEKGWEIEECTAGGEQNGRGTAGGIGARVIGAIPVGLGQ